MTDKYQPFDNIEVGFSPQLSVEGVTMMPFLTIKEGKE